MKIKAEIKIRTEWEKFIRGEKPEGVRLAVLKSWERCKDLGINPYGGKCNIILSGHELELRIKQNEKLIDVAKPYIDSVYKIIKDSDYVVFLTDKEANLLYLKGDKEALAHLREHINFTVGATWSESAVGTTAISIALTECVPVSFMAEENYCLELKQFACSAVPIKDIDGSIIGVLGVAACFPGANNEIFGMLIAAEMAIENHFRMMNTREQLSVISHYYKTIFDAVSDAIVIVDANGIISDINKNAQVLLQVDSKKIIGKFAGEVLGFQPVVMNRLQPGKFYGNNDVLFDFKNDRFRYKIKSAIPVLRESGEIAGVVNILTNEKKNCRADQKEDGWKAKYTFDDIIGASKEIKQVKKMAVMAAGSTCNILILGESGTGKEMFAQAIHNASHRAEGPFVAVNCGAIPRELIESEFFGYEAGAFTGALKGGRPGKFELAMGGTLFLDEIGEMPYALQTRLLRVLQEKEITRVGGSKPIPIDVRVIAATNKNLAEEVKKGSFRQDLYWRLNVITLQIPPLAQRRDDIPLLIEHFLNKHSALKNKKYTLDDKALKMLLEYHWPGNVRELENVIERVVTFDEDGVILPHHLPENIVMEVKNLTPRRGFSLEETEKQIIQQVLFDTRGNITKAAKILGIARNTLYCKIKKYQINVQKTNSC